MKTSHLLPVILLPLLLCSLAHVATGAAAIRNFPSHFSDQKAAHVAPWIALNQVVMQKLTASLGTEVKRPNATANGAHGTCGRNKQLCDCTGRCISITQLCSGCVDQGRVFHAGRRIRALLSSLE